MNNDESASVAIPAGPWCCPKGRMDWLADQARSARIVPPATMPSLLKTRREKGVAVVEVLGGMLIDRSMETSFTKMLGMPTYQALARAIDSAAAGRKTRAIMLHLEARGGTTQGIDCVLDAIRRARRKLRVEAASEFFLLGAGYIIAAHCQRITGGRLCKCGGIAVHRVVHVAPPLQYQVAPIQPATAVPDRTDEVPAWWQKSRFSFEGM
jgi:hypothetical protein